MSLLHKAVSFFDKLEDRVRGHLSRSPILYTLIGGVAIVLFWRGVWHTADLLQGRGGFLGFIFYEPVNLVIVVIILLLTGLFVSYFIGDTILISGLRSEKKLHEKDSKEIKEEEATLNDIGATIREIKKEVEDVREAFKEEHDLHHPKHT